MTDSDQEEDRHHARAGLEKHISVKQERKIKARKEGEYSAWFGLGMFGLVGWSVAVPTLIGVAIGLWIDSRWPSRFSWTLMLLFVGLILGCMNAWWWVQRERKRGENGD